MAMESKKLQYYPLAVKLKGKTALVIGGGNVAWRKIEALLYAGTNVKIISPKVVDAIKTAVSDGKVKWLARSVKTGDIKSADIVIAATNKKNINELISKIAGKLKIWVNVVDQPAISDFISPALLYKGKAIMAVYTDGKDPVLSRDLKNFLKDNWDEFLYYRNRLQNEQTQRSRSSVPVAK